MFDNPKALDLLRESLIVPEGWAGSIFCLEFIDVSCGIKCV